MLNIISYNLSRNSFWNLQFYFGNTQHTFTFFQDLLEFLDVIWAITAELLYYKGYHFICFNNFNHSHKKRKDGLETQVVLIENFMLCWNLASSPKHQGSLQKKTMTLPEGKKLIAGAFCANLDETNHDMVQFTKRWNWKCLV